MRLIQKLLIKYYLKKVQNKKNEITMCQAGRNKKLPISIVHLRVLSQVLKKINIDDVIH